MYQNIKIKARVNNWQKGTHKCLAPSLGRQIKSHREYSSHMHVVALNLLDVPIFQ